MGYSFEEKVVRGRKVRVLCCSACGLSGGVRRLRCPWGACPPVAHCPGCRKAYSYQHTKKYHRELRCDFQFTSTEKREARERYLLAGGGYLRSAAMNSGDGNVHVLFTNKDKKTVGYYMSPETYNAIPLDEPACVEDYSSKGELTPAPEDF